MSHIYVGNGVEKGDREDTAGVGAGLAAVPGVGALCGVTMRVYAAPGRAPQLECVKGPRS